MLKVNNPKHIQKRLFDGRVPKIMVFDTETAPYYEKVEPYEKSSWEKPNYNVLPGTLRVEQVPRRKTVEVEGDNGETVTKVYYEKENRYYWMTDVRQVQLIFDIGYTIADKKGNIFIKRNWLVDEIFADIKLMKNAYYFEKYGTYLRMLSDGDVKLEKWTKIMAQIEQDIIDYNISEAYAYNIEFDLGAVKNTQRIITKSQFLLFEDYSIKTNCIWGMAAETILSQTTFIRTAIENDWVSEKGNIKTNAEVAYRYITGEHDFIEDHTALSDAIIETAIVAKCYRTKKRMSFGIINQPWRIVKGVAEAKGLLPQ